MKMSFWYPIVCVSLSVLMFARPAVSVTAECTAMKDLYEARNCSTFHYEDDLCQALDGFMIEDCGFHNCTEDESKFEYCFADTSCPSLFAPAALGTCGLYVTTCEDFGSMETSSVPIQHELGFPVVCDDGWTILQWRTSGNQSFDMTFADYENGFGTIDTGYWLGLTHLYALLQRGTHQLIIKFNLGDGTHFELLYEKFNIGPPSEGYPLIVSHDDYNITLSTADGTGFEDLNGMKFTTKDHDEDLCFWCNCAVPGKGGWWYRSCSTVNLNGRWNYNLFNFGTTWQSESGVNHPLSFTAMQIRLVN